MEQAPDWRWEEPIRIYHPFELRANGREGEEELLAGSEVLTVAVGVRRAGEGAVSLGPVFGVGSLVSCHRATAERSLRLCFFSAVAPRCGFGPSRSPAVAVGRGVRRLP